MAKDKSKNKDKSKKEVKPIRVQLSDSTKDFSFTVSAKELDIALSKVSAVLGAAGSQAKSFVLLAVKGRVVLIGYNPDTYVYLLIKSGEAESDGHFGFQAQTVQGVIKGRNEINFAFKSGDVVFKDTKSKYNGTFHTQPVSSDQIGVVNEKFTRKAEAEEAESKTEKKLKLHSPPASILPRTVLDSLKEGIALTSIKDIYTGKALLSYMQLNEKGILTVSAFDNYHFGLYRCKVDAGGMTFKAALPSSHFLIIDRMVEGTEAKFHVMNENIRVEGEDFTLILPSTQTDPRNYDVIPGFVKNQPEAAFKAKYHNDQLVQLTENLFTLHSVNTSFEISYKDNSGHLDIVFKTTNGSASDSLKVEASASRSSNVKVKIDPRMLRDILGLFKAQKETDISIVPSSVIRFDAKTVSGAKVSLMSAMT